MFISGALTENLSFSSYRRKTNINWPRTGLATELRLSLDVTVNICNAYYAMLPAYSAICDCVNKLKVSSKCESFEIK